MPVRFTCGKCSHQASVKDELKGRKIKCPKCGEAVVVGAAAPAPAVKKAKKAVPDDDENPFAGLGDPSKFGTEIDEEDEDYEELMEAIRFRMYSVDRDLTQLGNPAEARAKFDQLRHALEAAGFHTRSHTAP